MAPTKKRKYQSTYYTPSEVLEKLNDESDEEVIACPTTAAVHSDSVAGKSFDYHAITNQEVLLNEIDDGKQFHDASISDDVAISSENDEGFNSDGLDLHLSGIISPQDSDDEDSSIDGPIKCNERLSKLCQSVLTTLKLCTGVNDQVQKSVLSLFNEFDGDVICRKPLQRSCSNSIMPDMNRVKLSKPCCQRNCLTRPSCDYVIGQLRDYCEHAQKQDKRQFCKAFVALHAIPNTLNLSTQFRIGSEIICQNSFIEATGIGKRTFQTWRKEHIAGDRSLLRQQQVLAPKGIRLKSEMVCIFIKDLAKTLGDTRPDRPQVYLPMCVNKQWAYNKFQQEMAELQQVAPLINMSGVSRAWFYRMWRKRFPGVLFTNENSDFKRCDMCWKIKNMELKRGEMNKDQIASFTEIKNNHISSMKKERAVYYGHRKVSQKTAIECNFWYEQWKKDPLALVRGMPAKIVICLIVDVMDQQKTCLPHMKVYPKDLTDDCMVQIRVSGAIVHGFLVDGHFDKSEWRKTSDIHISQIVQLLLDISKKYEDLPIFGEKTVLYIQLDNAADNKNKTMLSFIALLVEVGLCRKVQINMMKPGHTHEDIDSLFAMFSKHLTHNDATTLPALMNCFNECCVKNNETTASIPTVSTIRPLGRERDSVYNFSDLFKNNILSGITTRHLFKAVKNVNGTVQIKTKVWSTDKDWEVLENGLTEDNRFLRVPLPNWDIEDIKLIPPNFTGSKVFPSSSLSNKKPIQERANNLLQKLEGYLDVSAMKWWTEFITSVVSSIRHESTGMCLVSYGLVTSDFVRHSSGSSTLTNDSEDVSPLKQLIRSAKRNRENYEEIAKNTAVDESKTAEWNRLMSTLQKDLMPKKIYAGGASLQLHKRRSVDVKEMVMNKYVLVVIPELLKLNLWPTFGRIVSPEPFGTINLQISLRYIGGPYGKIFLEQHQQDYDVDVHNVKYIFPSLIKQGKAFPKRVVNHAIRIRKNVFDEFVQRKPASIMEDASLEVEQNTSITSEDESSDGDDTIMDDNDVS